MEDDEECPGNGALPCPIQKFRRPSAYDPEVNTVPLKPIYEKSPLKELRRLPLRCGNARTNLPMAEELLRLCAPHAGQSAFQAEMIRLTCLTGGDPALLPFWADLMAAVNDGSEALPGDIAAQIHTARALWAAFEYTADKAIIARLTAWCKSLTGCWDQVIAAVRTDAADLMVLLCDIYRVTGRKGVLTLCADLRRDMMDWSVLLNTFSVQRPLSRSFTREELTAAMEAEGHDPDGFHTRQYLTMRTDLLADGARAALASAGFSGSRQEGDVLRSGLPRLMRWHGAVCGGLTGDDTLAGTSPAAAVGTVGVGAWAEALSAAADEPAAGDALALLMANAVPAALQGGRVHLYQRVNTLSGADMTDRCYLSEADEATALLRLVRGVNAACEAAVMTMQDGAAVNLLLPGRYTVRTADSQFVLEIAGDTVTVRAAKPVTADILLRIPGWCDGCDISLNGKSTDRSPAGKSVRIRRTWQDGDALTITPCNALRTVKGHHQAVSVYDG